jgi:hypothetical protein
MMLSVALATIPRRLGFLAAVAVSGVEVAFVDLSKDGLSDRKERSHRGLRSDHQKHNFATPSQGKPVRDESCAGSLKDSEVC